MLKHVDPTEAYIDRRFTKDKHPVVSFFTSKEEAERAIHEVLKDNSSRIDGWLKNARDGMQSSLKDTPQGEELSSSRGPIGSARLRGAFKLQLSKKNTME